MVLPSQANETVGVQEEVLATHWTSTTDLVNGPCHLHSVLPPSMSGFVCNRKCQRHILLTSLKVGLTLRQQQRGSSLSPFPLPRQAHPKQFDFLCDKVNKFNSTYFTRGFWPTEHRGVQLGNERKGVSDAIYWGWSQYNVNALDIWVVMWPPQPAIKNGHRNNERQPDLTRRWCLSAHLAWEPWVVPRKHDNKLLISLQLFNKNNTRVISKTGENHCNFLLHFSPCYYKCCQHGRPWNAGTRSLSKK